MNMQQTFNKSYKDVMEARARRVERALVQSIESPYWLRAPLTVDDCLPHHPELASYIKEREVQK